MALIKSLTIPMCALFKKDLICLFLEARDGREKERERNINVWLPLTCPLLGTWPATQPCALTGNQPSDPLIHSLAPNPLSHTSQGNHVCSLIFRNPKLPLHVSAQSIFFLTNSYSAFKSHVTWSMKIP